MSISLFSAKLRVSAMPGSPKTHSQFPARRGSQENLDLKPLSIPRPLELSFIFRLWTKEKMIS
jgi:hypothetical protein